MLYKYVLEVNLSMLNEIAFENNDEIKQRDNKLSIFSFFSGSGFLDLGFEYEGYDIELVNEFFPPFIKAYQYSREVMMLKRPKYGYWNTDIQTFFDESNSVMIHNSISKERNKGKLVGFIGGPPCPDFSIAGKNQGKNGENGKLSMSYVKLILEQLPDFFVFENVKGLWRTKRHREFYEELKDMLHEAGYATTERLTNALEFGVPQDRDRILLIGIQKKLMDDNKYLDNSITGFPWEKYMSYELVDVKSKEWPTTDDFVEDNFREEPNNIIEELTVEFWFELNRVYDHPNKDKFFTPRAGLEKMKVINEGDVSKKSYKRVHRWRYAPTSAYGNNEVHLHPYKARRLSASEALALQSIPSSFYLPNDMTLSNMFKTIGNGVPFLLAKGIAQSLRDFLEDMK